MSVNSLFDIGSTSLRAVGEKIDATSQNIANAESEGYRRRRVSLSSRSVAATGLYASNGAQDVTSSGVGVEQFERVRDGMLVAARNEARSSESAAREEGRVLGVLEGALATDTDAGLSASLQGLADGFSNLAINPDSQGVRESVLGRARQLTDTFGRLDQRLGELTTNTENALAGNVEKANGLLDKVASLNEQIENARAGGSPDYAAEDQRDQTVKELSKLLPVEAQENRSDGYTLTVDGMTVVQGTEATNLSVDQSGNTPAVEFGKTGVEFTPGAEGGGEIGAQARLLNDTLPGVQSDLDALADDVVKEVNAAHRKGADQNGDTGENFFVDKSGPSSENTAGNIELNVDGPKDIAAVATPALGTLGGNETAVTIGQGDFGDSSGAGNIEDRLTVGPDGSASTVEVSSISPDGNLPGGVEGGTFDITVEDNANTGELDFTIDRPDGSTSTQTGVDVGSDGTTITLEDDGSGNTLKLDVGTAFADGDVGPTETKEFSVTVDNSLPGNTGPAQNIADVASDLTTGATDLAAGVGTQVQEAAAKEEAQAAVGERVQAQIEDVSGVSVDQQLSSLIEQQQQFAASAQVLTTAREVSSTLLSIAR
ncbi:flagellar hook-associated protein FlgK [Salinibacter ruber]|uniref:Flagellar hook-associated protein 1 n=1 Tax=Salinibacter ruber TaxID=146919 RepID=A0A9X2ZRH0_9BACT|nr:flagellar hook-associated protein FlgK [Salinibacter ruber]MCS3663839.1 flagellar hook-associated protein 1 FlgK [Salinibacter ruber]MCS4057704.1 flagellar hook-associated protein 1 FlgK [Salinibacter ruber]MCS4059762.1 flagellar hook-associated protein 1 FlgK [Salinibacter ruber]MCS4086586.1 flagellar hook-associated protein 1 FlgK [Salinibacter ruber]MCS4120355.1 flagellar hook-associated protein 1 FlgK [Salinibacter ruber]